MYFAKEKAYGIGIGCYVLIRVSVGNIIYYIIIYLYI